ncbi:LysR family transcriptional regulator [Aliiglaciecola sp. LCG003]|uniref:LysR family transcriptional regulator n=1 Tax=Aliiglaciecola sp. LCG003 TaxID=3053655 RepID=UPI002572680C|nr:LysR family transcriptional regulator [Aliiglaciecola sp. LCG003]WJG08547.1 LysR family transcriptional regulator [Aliiglaciecola sp. LCG003]
MADMKRIQQLDLNLLKVFESLYQEQNMTRTAERLHITPSAVSHGIKRLRDCLQDPLFQRSQNKMLPTPACQRMAPMIIDTLSRLRQILQQWGEFNPLSSQHHFRIGMHDALEPSILPRVSRLLAQRAPHVTLSSIKVERSQLKRMLAAGHVDFVFDIAMPIKLPIRHQKMLDDGFSILLDKHHWLRGGMSAEQYFDCQHISVSHRPSGAAVEDLYLQEQGLSRITSVRCQNYYAAKDMLKSANWLLTLPTSLARQLKDDGLEIVKVPFAMPAIATHLYWHQNTEQDHGLLWFRGLLTELISVKLPSQVALN